MSDGTTNTRTHFIHPVLQILKCIVHIYLIHIVNQDTCIRPTIVSHSQRLEPFLSSGVPNLLHKRKRDIHVGGRSKSTRTYLKLP